MSPDFFKGIKILELANVLAGPAVGMFFAELGAEVIKLENISGGDVTRSWRTNNEDSQTDISAYFSSVNWGKKSISVDLKAEEGQSILNKLVANSDIIISSFKKGDAAKLSADYGTISQINPQIIYAQITGYGDKSLRGGYDAIIQAESGFMSMNGTEESGPVKMPVALMDILTAHQLKEAILLAMIKKMRNNEGSYISVSLIHSAIASLANQATNWLVADHNPVRSGSEHPNIAPYGTVYTTKDGREVILAVGTNKQFNNLTKILNIAEVAQQEKYATNHQRVKNRTELSKILENKIKTFNSEALLSALEAAEVPAGGIYSVQEVFEQNYAQELLLTSKNIKGLRTTAFLTTMKSSDLSAPPHLAEHTDQILKDVGFDIEKIKDLRSKEIIK